MCSLSSEWIHILSLLCLLYRILFLLPLQVSLLGLLSPSYTVFISKSVYQKPDPFPQLQISHLYQFTPPTVYSVFLLGFPINLLCLIHPRSNSLLDMPFPCFIMCSLFKVACFHQRYLNSPSQADSYARILKFFPLVGLSYSAVIISSRLFFCTIFCVFPFLTHYHHHYPNLELH